MKVILYYKMYWLPIDIINIICEFAAKDDKEWYPFFCPINNKCSWKVNKYYTKNINNTNIILQKRIEYCVIHINNYLTNTINTYPNCKIITFNNYFYIVFDSDIEMYDQFIFRAMLPKYDKLINNNYLYLNGTLFGIIIENTFIIETNEIYLTYEIF